MQSCHDEGLIWRNNDPFAYNWIPYFSHIVNKLKGQTDKKVMDGRQGNLKDVISCDINAEVIVPAITFPVTIISINYCLEHQYTSMELCDSAIKVKLYNMLVPSFLVMLSGIECTWS